jgi:NitT/TauT family transport system substrate-binding protein
MMFSLPHPDAVAVLLAGKAGPQAMTTPPYVSMLSKRDNVHAMIISRDILGLEDATGVVLAVSRAFVESNPGVCKTVIATLEDAITVIAKDPDKAADICPRYATSAKITKQDVLEMLTDGSISYSVSTNGVLKYARFMARTGQLKHEPKSCQDVFFPLNHDRSGS